MGLAAARHPDLQCARHRVRPGALQPAGDEGVPLVRRARAQGLRPQAAPRGAAVLARVVDARALGAAVDHQALRGGQRAGADAAAGGHQLVHAQGGAADPVRELHQRDAAGDVVVFYLFDFVVVGNEFGLTHVI